METQADTGREFWRGVLTTGGFTAIPRWTLTPRAGVGELEVPIPNGLAAAIRQLAEALVIPTSTVLLAAHVKVLSALSGASDVVTGYVPGPGAQPVPCPLSSGHGSWRRLLRHTHRSQSELLAHRDFPIGALAYELGVAIPAFETVVDPNAVDAEFDEGTVLRVEMSSRGDRPVLRVRYRMDAVDTGFAGRVAGYHLRALELMTADPDAEHDRQSLLSAEELDHQLEKLQGPGRSLPDLRFHELFERRVKANPHAVAGVQGDRRWTYGELNARANRLGRALLAHGLRREDVVAVVTERNLDWMAAVIAVFKAGGVYLPIEPHFPADRIATTLTRADCRLVLTEAGSRLNLDRALDTLPGIRTLPVGTSAEDVVTTTDGKDAENLGIVVTPGQLAYIYFTSGSTGEPKGAMCEHAGMLNHLYAKIDDLQIGEGQVVAQTAPQCFDISLWQLVSGLLVGGTTLLIEQELILDVERFVDAITDGRVAVLQLVPSYLEVVLTFLEQHPRDLPDLRCVSVTGEALKRELAQRWFAARPGIKLVNAYGLTETSDDTNHEVMDRAPDGDRVPLGRPVSNVRIYIVDEHLAPVPLGAPGAIVFSGICVGRGYVNDPERTRLSFMADPHHEGNRLYQAGDYGRWLPDGKLEFLGRRDSQVKIRGFRIEIGEIDNALLRVPGVRDAAVVVAERADHGKQLVAFYSGPEELGIDLLRERLARSLPEYMVPSAFHWRERLPLTANSKIDRKALTLLAGSLDVVEVNSDAPVTATEHRLAAAWAKVLGTPQDQIGRHDHFFFDCGGSSLSAVKLAIALNRAVSLTDVTRHPVLADLAALIDGRTPRRTGLLQLLAEPAGPPAVAMVCFPYAGGNAVNYQLMANALRDNGIAVYGVELPGHDMAGEPAPFASVEQTGEQVAAEITRLGPGGVMLWGHSSGAVLALETARRLQAGPVQVLRVFIGAQLVGDVATRHAAGIELTRQSNTDIAAGLIAQRGVTALGELDAQGAERVGAAYRHDCVTAHRYLIEALQTQQAPRLSTPVSVVVAADDPFTADSAHRHRDWDVLAEHVDLHVLPDGGHYFIHTRPAETVRVVQQIADQLELSAPAVPTR